MALDLFVVDFEDIYEVLMDNDDPMHDEEACLEYLEKSENPNVRNWMDQISMNGDVLTDIKSIIEYYLEENGE